MALRDAALARISRTRRWTLAAAAALTAGLAALASALLPGKSFGAKASTVHATRSATSNSSGTPALPAPANAAQLGVGQGSESAAPAPAPQAQPAPSAPAAVSGGS
jgi:hypothetical protein